MAKTRSPQIFKLNYIYFGLVLLLLAPMHIWSVFITEKFTDSSPWLFIGHALFQAGLEAFVLAYIAAYIHAKNWRIIEGVFVTITVLLCVFHAIDFHLVHLMDVSLWAYAGSLFGESWRNFVEVLVASTVSFSKIFLGLAAIGLGIAGAIWFFVSSQKFVAKKGKSKKFQQKPLIILGAGFLILCGWEIVGSQNNNPVDHERYAKALPWKRGLFVSPTFPQLECSLNPNIDPSRMRDQLDAHVGEALQKPNIYLFVVESLREEFINEVNAPNLIAMRKKDGDMPYKAFSGSNGTSVSWFSIFYSQAPLYYGDVHRSGWKGGSPVLEQFKKAGYKIHLYSGSRLSYFGMDELIFGENLSLTEDVHFDFPSEERPAWKSDHAVISKLCDDIQKYKDEEGHLFITFIESTHFDYSWPAETETIFSPYSDKISFVKAVCFQGDIEGIKNRYRNAIHYVDKLVGNCITTLEKEKRFDDSIFIVTGDHGEEFFERGNLFHASILCDEQITVPLYFHVGNHLQTMKEKYPCPSVDDVMSHLDIMPTLMHMVFGENYGKDLFYGASLFSDRNSSTAMTGRYNGGHSPYEFFLKSAKASLHARFSNPKEPSLSNGIDVIAFEKNGNAMDQVSLESIVDEFGDAFLSIFKTAGGQRI